MSNSKHNPPPNAAEIEAHIHAIVTDLCAAVNNRNFSPTASPWNQMSSSFSGIAAVSGDPLGKPSGAMNADEYLEGLSRLCEFFPAFYLTPISINPEATSRKRATCLLSMEYSGMGEGIVRPCVATLDFRLMDQDGREKWMCTKMFSFEGLLGDGFEFPGAGS